MRRFKNKKLATTLVVFLLVFIMAGAFAAFQTILDVRGRVNMYAPTVDAIISNLTPIAAPLGLLNDVADPQALPGAPTANAEVRGPWLALAPSAYQSMRFEDRNFFEVPWYTADPSLEEEITPAQSLSGLTNLPPAHPWVSAVAGTAGTQRDQARQVAWWAWGHDRDDSADTHVPYPFVRPARPRVDAASIVDPSLFETLYLNLTFDNFSQFYYFHLELANVGVVPLEVDEVVITRVNNPAAATPAWDIETYPAIAADIEMLRDAAATGVMHPIWATMAGSTIAGYTVADADGLMGLFNVLVDMDPSGHGAVSGWVGGTTNAAIIPVRTADVTNRANTIDVGLRFCVALENWEVFLDGYETWGPAIVVGFGGAPGLSGDALTAALLDILLDHALSGTFRIEYTVVPFEDVAVGRPPTGVRP